MPPGKHEAAITVATAPKRHLGVKDMLVHDPGPAAAARARFRSGAQRLPGLPGTSADRFYFIT